MRVDSTEAHRILVSLGDYYALDTRLSARNIFPAKELIPFSPLTELTEQEPSEGTITPEAPNTHSNEEVERLLAQAMVSPIPQGIITRSKARIQKVQAASQPQIPVPT